MIGWKEYGLNGVGEIDKEEFEQKKEDPLFALTIYEEESNDQMGVSYTSPMLKERPQHYIRQAIKRS